MKTLHPLLFALACLLGACADEPPPRVEPEPARPEVPAAPAPAPSDVEPTADEVPIVEDFEEQAKAEIKPDNLRAQLDALEHEIEQDSR